MAGAISGRLRGQAHHIPSCNLTDLLLIQSNEILAKKLEGIRQVKQSSVESGRKKISRVRGMGRL